MDKMLLISIDKMKICVSLMHRYLDIIIVYVHDKIKAVTIILMQLNRM